VGGTMILGLLINVAIIISFVCIFGLISRYFNLNYKKLIKVQVIYGLGAGLLSILLMTNSYQIIDNSILDLRIIPLAMAGVYGGILSIGIAALEIVLFRSFYFDWNDSSLIALITIVIMTFGTMLISKINKSNRIKYSLMTVYNGFISLILIIVLLYKDTQLPYILLEFILVYFIGAFLTFLVSEYMKRANEQFSEMKYYQMMTNHLSELLTRCNIDGTFIYVSPSIKSILGYERVEVMGYNYYNFIHPEDLPNVKRVYQTATLFNDLYSVVYRFKSKDGNYIWLESSIKNNFDKNKINHEIVSISHDISDRIKIEKELIDSEVQISHLLESNTDGFFVLDNHWRFTYLNPMTEKILGKTKQLLIGKVIWEEFPEICGSNIYEAYHRVLNEQVPITEQVYYPVLETWFETKAYPTKNGISVYYHDITAQKKY